MVCRMVDGLIPLKLPPFLVENLLVSSVRYFFILEGLKGLAPVVPAIGGFSFFPSCRERRVRTRAEVVPTG